MDIFRVLFENVGPLIMLLPCSLYTTERFK
jgi:hypothetical protein